MIPPLVTPVEILTGVSLALVFGTVSAAVVGCIGFATRYVGNETIPPAAGGVATLVITGTGLYAAAAVDLSTVQSGLFLGVGLCFLLGVYATSRGNRLAADLPRTAAGSVERTQPLAADAIDAVDAVGQVTVRSSGAVRELEGYPPLGPELRATLEDGAWRLPVDLPVSALETRLGDKLRMIHDLEAVSVAIDGRGRATITAAPPANGIAKQVPEGWRAVSIRALLPTGLAPGDDVLVATGSETVPGTVLDATVDAVADGGHVDADSSAPDGTWGDDRSEERGGSLPTDAAASGGDGYVTFAVPTTEAEPLLETDRARIVVRPRGAAPELASISLLERDGTSIRRVTVTEAVLDAVSADEAEIDVFAIRKADPCAGDLSSEHEWRFEPELDALPIGTEAFLLGPDAGGIGPEPDEREPPVLEGSH